MIGLEQLRKAGKSRALYYITVELEVKVVSARFHEYWIIALLVYKKRFLKGYLDWIK